MTIAVCLLSCGREDYTRRTVESFNAFNDRSDLIRLHADDASPTPENRRIAAAGGFDTIYATQIRQGQAAALWALLREAERRRAEWVLWLENDWLFSGAVPWDALRYGAECVRLYGDWKSPTNRAGKFLMGTKDVIRWQPIGDGLERGEAHWAGPPSITRTHVLAGLSEHAGGLKAVSLAGPIDTIRLTTAIVEHIGEVQTPDFMP